MDKTFDTIELHKELYKKFKLIYVSDEFKECIDTNIEDYLNVVSATLTALLVEECCFLGMNYEDFLDFIKIVVSKERYNKILETVQETKTQYAFTARQNKENNHD